jgi:hypothetical protein
MSIPVNKFLQHCEKNRDGGAGFRVKTLGDKSKTPAAKQNFPAGVVGCRPERGGLTSGRP